MNPHITTEIVDTFTHVTWLEFEHKGEFMIANVDATLKIVDNKFALETVNSWSLCECVHPFLLHVLSKLTDEQSKAVYADLGQAVTAALVESIAKLPEQVTTKNEFEIEPTNSTEHAT